MLEKDEDGYDLMLYLGRSIRLVYPVGPLIDRSDRTDDRIIKWLNDKPIGAVVFLCFGSRGALGVAQVQDIAHGLKRSGYNFL
ncbi:UDP-glycosyltransferase 71K2 [Vitis vinifera]|uniref:UDP-glycosyltransferase 71K2 n=1 Tax=Vitis vinifera TaxID=29760 RepID=A0A438IB60_VITVI|nr:UDP-glycosyltransferase 71K2 [Vitis vinifera]